MLTKELTAHLPDAPGVYFFQNRRGELLYIGKAKSLRKRVRQYTAPPERLTAKVRRLVRQTHAVEYEVLGSELEALIVESRLIKERQPRYNVLLKRFRRFPFLKIQRRERFPRVLVCSEITLDGSDYFGPFPNRGVAEATRDLLHQLFPIRTCEMAIVPNPGARPCFNYHIGRCKAPCAARQSEESYDRMLENVCAFLLGDHRTRLAQLLEERQRAVDRLEFEHARLIQNRIEALERYAQRHRFQVNAVRNNHLVVVCPSRQPHEAELFFVRAGRLRRQERVSRLLRDGKQLDEAMRDVFLTPDDVAPLTDWELDAMNILSQWLYANRNRQEIVPVNGLTEEACREAIERIDAALLSAPFLPSVEGFQLHAL